MRLFFVLIALSLSLCLVRAQKKPSPTAVAGYQIPIALSPLTNCWVYIGYYYGKYSKIVDSVWLDDHSKTVFKGEDKLPAGVYFVLSPQKKLVFQFLIDEQQRFSIKADTAHAEKVVIKGSPENVPFQEYNDYMNANGPKVNALLAQWKAATNPADSARLYAAWVKAQKELFGYRDIIEQKYPESMFALFLRSMKVPDSPPAPVLPDGRIDSLFPARYVKAHYWDNVALHDDRILRTPFFDGKLEEYFRYYVVPDADTLIGEVNYLLLASRTSKEMFNYLLGRFTDKYINPEIMGHDKVFIFLFNEYFSKGDTTWFTAKQKEYIFNRAYSLMANQIGETAAALNLLDTAGKQAPMYAIKAPFTFVVFWDPNCGHCKEMIPRIDSIYEAKWKKEGVGVYAVNIDEKAMDDWKKYIQAHHLTGWVHAYQPKEDRDADAKANRANFRQLYDVFQTPTLYLLDSEKRIIGKKLSLDQFDQVMQAKRGGK